MSDGAKSPRITSIIENQLFRRQRSIRQKQSIDVPDFEKTYAVIIFSDKAKLRHCQDVEKIIQEFKVLTTLEVVSKTEKYLYLSATTEALLHFADVAELSKLTITGSMQKFNCDCISDYLLPGMTPADIVREYEGPVLIKDMIKPAIMSYIRNGIIEDFFPLHNIEYLDRFAFDWRRSRLPIEDICNYFGSSIALYFGFTEFYTKALIFPAIFGMLQYMWNVNLSLVCSFYVLWTTIFLELWKRRCSGYSYRWGNIEMSSLDKPRSAYHGVLKPDPITGKMMLQYPMRYTYLQMYCVSYPVVLICVAAAAYFALYQFQIEAEVLADFGPDSLLLYIPVIVQSILIAIFSWAYEKLATFLTDQENHRTRSQYDRHRVNKLMLFEIVNNFFSLFYIAFVLQDLKQLKYQLMMQLLIFQIVCIAQGSVAYTMKTNPALDHVYVNDGFKCSSISITTNGTEQNGGSGGSQGSNEFILTKDGKKMIPPVKTLDCAKAWVQDRTRRTFNRKTLHKRLPIFSWLPKYSKEDAVGDVVAGLTVGLTVIPQALAYAGVAGLPAAYGLYGSFLGCFIYIFLGNCKDVPVGPSAIVALLTFQTAKGSWQLAVLLTLLCGIVELFMGIFGLGFLLDFVSGPVSSGFTSAVSLIIVASQVKDILGIPAPGTTFLEILTHIYENVKETRASDTVLGVTCIVVLLMMRLLSSFKLGPKEPTQRTKTQNVLNKIIWLVGTSRNAILVVVCGVLAYILNTESGSIPFRVIGYIPAGMPAVQPPPFRMTANETLSGRDEDFIDMVKNLGSGLIVLPLISLMETVSIAKAFGNGKPVDASQELIAIGVANIANAFVQSFPSTGALSRGAVNNASGVRTPLSNIYSSSLVILALIFFTPYFFFIPKSTLAAIIIAAVMFMVEVRVIKPMWRAKKSDLVPGLGTFIACLVLPLEIGILIGVGLNVIFILYHAARPKITTEILTTSAGNEYLMITPDRCLMFPSVDYVRNLVTKQSLRQNVPVVIDASHIYGADFTAATVIESLLGDFTARSQLLFFYNLKPSICALFETLSTDFVVYYQEEQLDQLLKDRNYEQKKSITV